MTMAASLKSAIFYTEFALFYASSIKAKPLLFQNKYVSLSLIQYGTSDACLGPLFSQPYLMI